MKTTGFPQVAALLAGLALSLGACVHDVDGEASSAEPVGAAPQAAVDRAGPGAPAWRKGLKHGAKRHFEEADENGDGKVTNQELSAAMAARFATIDANQDGQLTTEELAAMRGKRQGERLAEIDADGDGAISRDEAPPRMQRHFDQVDADGDGKVTAGELREGWGKHRRGKGKAGQAMHLDTDGDGLVSADEFAKRAFRWFERADGDGDGEVTLAELSAMPRGKHGRHGRRGGMGSGQRGFMAKHLLAADADQDGQITKAEAEAFKAAKFDELDQNRDGVLSDAERPRRRGGNRAGLPGRMHRADADGDGQVTKAEFVAGSTRWFDRLDADGDGVIQQAELDSAKARFGRGMGGKPRPRGAGR